eukprot:111628-Heterocapsa_arctica.AAC.1
MAARLFGASAGLTPVVPDKLLGGVPVISGARQPMVVNLATRPCSTSAGRWPAKFSVTPSAAKPTGFQKPTGACIPSSLSNELSGKAVCRAQFSQADPIRPSRRGTLKVAILARWPFAVSPVSARLLTSPFPASPAGSQWPTGACTPRLFSRARSGKNQSPQPEPEKPTRKNVPRFAIMARRPFAISEGSFLSSGAWLTAPEVVAPRILLAVAAAGDSLPRDSAGASRTAAVVLRPGS